VYVGDYNGDGAADLVVQEFSEAHLWRYNLTTRVFDDLGNILPGAVTGLSDTALTVADFTGDGATDVIVQDNTVATRVRGGAALTTGARMTEFPRSVSLTPWRLGDPLVTTRAFGLIAQYTDGARFEAPTLARAYPFQELGFRRADLPAGRAQLFVDDFNNDARGDQHRHALRGHRAPRQPPRRQPPAQRPQRLHGRPLERRCQRRPRARPLALGAAVRRRVRRARAPVPHEHPALDPRRPQAPDIVNR